MPQVQREAHRPPNERTRSAARSSDQQPAPTCGVRTLRRSERTVRNRLNFDGQQRPHRELTLARGNDETEKTVRLITAGALSWLIPGAGHWYLGHRSLAIVFFSAVTFAFWMGAMLGGVKYSVNVRENPWLFLAEIWAGGYTILATLIGFAIQHIPADIARFKGFYPEMDVAQIYLSTAGLLSIMVILDAMARAHMNGLPTFYREMLAHEAKSAAEPHADASAPPAEKPA